MYVCRLIFYLSASGAPGTLHSFPTRRSSDLLSFSLQPTYFSDVNGDGLIDVVHNIDQAVAVEDRKSTRLNSSHRCISYAVFCLKKKKTNVQTMCELALYVQLNDA